MSSLTSQEHKETGRIEAFSDGVFAVAITLLILTIRVPTVAEQGSQSLYTYVIEQWPFFLAYLVSFMSILVMWSNHHGIFNLVVRADRRLVIINGILLMFITFVNYPTAIIAAAMVHDNKGIAAIVGFGSANERFAVSLYTGTLIIVTVAFQIFWRYIASHRHLLDEHVDPAVVQQITREYRFGPAFYIAAFILGYFIPLAGIIATLALAIYFGLTARVEPVHSKNGISARP